MRPRRLPSRLSRALAAATALCLAAGVIEAETIRLFRVAIRGQLAVPGASYLLFGDIDIDSLGRVLYTTSFTDGRGAIFREDRGTATPLLFSFDPIPGSASGDRLWVLLEVSGNASDDVAFIATTFLTQEQHVFLLHDGDLVAIARVGHPAPAPADDTFLSFDQVRLLDDGTVYFSARIAGPEGERRGVYRYADGELRPAIVPGRRYGGERQVHETLQFDVNETGDLSALVRIIGADLPLLDEEPISEIVLESGGVLRTLASSQFTLSGGLESVRHFAITFDQVHIDEAGGASFYASTTQHLQGGVFVNDTGAFLKNASAVADGDIAPTGATDRFRQFGPFDRNANGMLLFTATTDQRPQGGFFVQKDGAIKTIGLVGEEEPGGVGLWTGFLMAEANDHDEFVVTDRDGLIQTGVFRGRVVPDLPDLLEAIKELAAAPGIDASLRTPLRRRVQVLVAASGRPDGRLAAVQAGRLRDWIAAQGDRLEPAVAVRLDILLDDLLYLTAP